MMTQHEWNRARDLVLSRISSELCRAVKLHPPRFNSELEGWAVMHEEMVELFDAIRKKNTLKADHRMEVAAEATQVGAMAARFLIDLIVATEDGAP